MCTIKECVEKINQSRLLTKTPLIVLVGKSSSGKTEIAKYISEHFCYNNIVSHTTRPKRTGEIDGINYYYTCDDIFQSMFDEGLFIETTEYRGWRYGISKKELIEKSPGIVVTDIAGVRNLERAGIENISFYIERSDRDRFISAISRGDDIMEIALRNERDKACYQNVEFDVNFIVYNNTSIEDCVYEILLAIAERVRK